MEHNDKPLCVPVGNDWLDGFGITVKYLYPFGNKSITHSTEEPWYFYTVIYNICNIVFGRLAQIKHFSDTTSNREYTSIPANRSSISAVLTRMLANKFNTNLMIKRKNRSARTISRSGQPTNQPLNTFNVG